MLAVNGIAHGIENFVPLSLAAARDRERDVREWRNPSFREVRKPRQKGAWPFTSWKNWTLGGNGLLPAPGTWVALSPTGTIELVRNPDNPADYRLRLSDQGSIFQMHHNRSDKAFKIKLRAAGTGAFAVGVNRYRPLETGGHRYLGSGGLKGGAVAVHSADWKEVEFVYEKPDAGEVFAVALAHHDGDVLIDDVYVYPASE